MPQDVSLRCQCGSVEGTLVDVTPTNGTRVVCYCDDCQTFAEYLGLKGIRDARGGTDVVQRPLNTLKITKGKEHLKLLRQHPKGSFRWYAGCCRTPIGNTVSGKVPFIGVVHSFIAEPEKLDAVFGKAVGVQGKFAQGGAPDGVAATVPMGMMLKLILMLAGWKIAGKTQPTPFFDPDTREPTVAPTILTLDERNALRKAIGLTR